MAGVGGGFVWLRKIGHNHPWLWIGDIETDTFKWLCLDITNTLSKHSSDDMEPNKAPCGTERKLLLGSGPNIFSGKVPSSLSSNWWERTWKPLTQTTNLGVLKKNIVPTHERTINHTFLS